MSAKKQLKSKRRVKRAGSKVLRANKAPNSYPRKDGKVAPK